MVQIECEGLQLLFTIILFGLVFVFFFWGGGGGERGKREGGRWGRRGREDNRGLKVC